jgi:Family of unknown function (DUF6541)
MNLTQNNLWYIAAGVMLLLLPGIAWQSLFKSPNREFFEVLAQAAGLSISLFSLYALYTHLLGLKFSLAGVLVFLLICLVVVILSCWRFIGYRSRDNQGQMNVIKVSLRKLIAPLKKTNTLIMIGLGVIFVLILGWRFIQLRGVLLPAWVDSVHHVLIIRVILDNRALPSTLEPYLPVPFYYHFAFHWVTAIYSFLTHLPPVQATLIFGHILNAAIALSVYRLGQVLWRDWRRAGLAAILVGFVSQMPAYYLTWGRYPLLTGMLILPLAMAEALETVKRGFTLSSFLALALLTSGLLLTHYYAALLFAIFLVVLIFMELINHIHEWKSTLVRHVLPVFIAGGLGFIFALPWLLRMWRFTQTFTSIGTLLPTLDAVERAYFPNYIPYLWKLLGPFHNHLLLFLAIPGLVMAIWRKWTRPFGIWALILSLLSMPWMIQIAPFRPDHAAIVLFLPVSLLVSDLFVSLTDWIGRGRFGYYKVIVILLPLLALITWGLWQTRSVVNASTILVDKADVKALEWIQSSTPPDANFLINVSPWQAGIFRGVDGGWWITPLTGRSTFLPPALYPLGPQKYVDQINQFAGSVSQLTGCTAELRKIIEAARVNYVYIHDGKGNLTSESLKNCPGLIELYNQQGVHIYQVFP